MLQDRYLHQLIDYFQKIYTNMRENFKIGSARNMSTSMSAGVYGARQAGRRDGYNTNINKPISENRHKAASGVKLLK